MDSTVAQRKTTRRPGRGVHRARACCDNRHVGKMAVVGWQNPARLTRGIWGVGGSVKGYFWPAATAIKSRKANATNAFLNGRVMKACQARGDARRKGNFAKKKLVCQGQTFRSGRHFSAFLCFASIEGGLQDHATAVFPTLVAGGEKTVGDRSLGRRRVVFYLSDNLLSFSRGGAVSTPPDVGGRQSSWREIRRRGGASRCGAKRMFASFQRLSQTGGELGTGTTPTVLSKTQGSCRNTRGEKDTTHSGGVLTWDSFRWGVFIGL